MSGNTYVDEFRGTDELYIAEVLVDDNEVGSGHGYITGTPELLAPVAEISRTVATASETKYYNNGPALTINAEGADTVNINVPALPLAVLAHITGKKIDASTGGLMDGESTPPYMALGYRLGLTDGTYRYVWRLKGTFAVPAETSQTKDAGTDSQGQQLVFTGINTIHKFTKAVDAQGNAMTQKAWVCDERDMKADLSGFCSKVTTCDNGELEEKAEEAGPDLIITDVLSEESLEELLARKEESLSDYPIGIITIDEFIDNNREKLDQLVKDKTIVSYLPYESKETDILVKMVLPIMKPDLKSDESLENIGSVADLLGIPGVSAVISAYTAGRDIKSTLEEGELGVSGTATIIGDIASVLGLDTVASVAGLVDDVDSIKAAVDREAGAHERKSGVNAAKDVVEVVSDIINKE